MNTIQEDAVNHFILDYLPPSSNNISLSKTKCITQLKRRIIRVDALQKHCQTLNHHLSEKGRELEDTLKKLDSTQEDYKQTSLEYKEILENASRFEMDNQKLRAALETLERQHIHAVTQLGASQSHIVQLEQLVIQKDKKIESMEKYDPRNIEKIIQDRIGAQLKEKDREKILWKKKYERLHKKMKDIESKKKKALQSTEYTSDCQSLDGHSDNEDSVEYMSQLIEQELSQDNTRMIKTTPDNIKECIELDNDSNEIVSIDTGCGSSLASSDNEKWLNSPDYNFSPIHAGNMENYRGRKLTTVGTSPILLKNVSDMATSPIITNDAETSPIKPMKNTDVCASPINVDFEADISKSEYTNNGNAINPCVISSDSTNILNNITKETANNLVNISENIVENMQENENTKDKTVKKLGTKTLNCINDVVMSKIMSKTKEGNVKPVIRIEDMTNPDTQININATEQSISELANVWKDISSPDLAQEEQETMSTVDETNSKVNKILINLPANNVKESCSDTDEIEHKTKNINKKVNLLKDTTSPDSDIEEQENDTNLIEISKNPLISDIQESPSDTKEIELKTENVNKKVNLFKDITSLDSDIDEETDTKLIEISNNPPITDIQESSSDTKTENINEKVNIFNDITSPDSDIEEETTSTTEETDTHVIETLNNPSITDIQENSSDTKEIEHNMPVVLEESITHIQEKSTVLVKTSDLKDVAQIKEAKEKELLNVNSNNGMNVDNDMDNEIEMIFNSMRFNHKLITPLPRTPVKPISQPANKKSCDILLEELTHTTCQDAAIAKDLAGAAKEEAASAREYVTKIREDHIKLMADFNKLQKDMINIKSMFKNQLLLRDNTKHEENDIVSTPSNDFSSVSLQDRSTKRCCILNLNQSQDQIEEHDYSDKIYDELQKPEININNSFNSEKIHTSVSKSRKKLRLDESQDRLTIVANNSAEISQKGENTLDMLNPLAKEPVDKKIKIISDNIIKPTELEHLKSKQDWENFIRESKPTAQEYIVQQFNKEQHKDLPLEVESYNDGIRTDEELDKSQDEDNKKKKSRKTKKISNLDKYRKKLEKPLFKIKRETPPLRKSSIKPKQLRVCLKKITDFDNSATLNDKKVYANAVKIMAELKAKNSKISAKTITDVETPIEMGKDNDGAVRSDITPKNEVSSIPTKDSDSNFLKPTEITSSKSTSLCSSSPTKSSIVTRSRKMSEQCNNNTSEGSDKSVTQVSKKSLGNMSRSPVRNKSNHQNVTDTPVASRKRKLSDCPDTPTKRVLRNTQNINTDVNKTEHESDKKEPIVHANKNPKESILCVMIQKYGMHSMRYKSRNAEDEDTKTVCENIELFMSDTQQLTCKQKRDELVEDLQNYSYKKFIGGLMLYLNNPERKCELFSKMSGVPSQIQITKSEAVLMYVIKQLRKHWSSVDLVEAILSNIEYILFRLNQTPTFDVVESMSHFYAVLCRLSDDRDRLITFMLDSMYCILFKSVVLIKQCLEAWPNIIPLAHMSKAKTPLMTCFVYLLHFFKCEDKFNRLPEIRNILRRTYYYEIKDWNEMKIIDLLKCSIKELRDNEHDKKMLRIAMIVFGKRHGPKWTNSNIIKKIIQPFIESQSTQNYVKVFCIALIGPLYKPYPVDMKVHCDIALDQLVNILNTTKSKQIAEAALSSIVLMGRHNYQRVTEVLISRKMDKISPELEELICDHVRFKTVNTWLRTLPKIYYDYNKPTNK